MKKRELVLVVHNVRSCHNVGSILRTSDGLGVNKVYLTGYTPYPELPGDSRMPHERSRISKQIQKTALGAEKNLDWAYASDVASVLKKHANDGFQIVALEQTPTSQGINDFEPRAKTVLVVGNETDGLDKEVLKHAGVHLEIPMSGSKESFNVAIAAAIALFHFSLSP